MTTEVIKKIKEKYKILIFQLNQILYYTILYIM